MKATSSDGESCPDGTTGLTAQDIVDVVREGYGRDVVEQQPLGGEVDQNVRVRTSAGEEFLLKASATAVDDDQLQWQNEVLAHVAAKAPELPLPRLLESIAGTPSVPLSRGTRTYAVRLLTWLPGRMLVELEQHDQALLTELGRTAGRLTQALSDMPVLRSVGSHHWDVRRMRASVDFGLGHVEDDDARRTVDRVMAWYDPIAATLDTLPTGVVHQDLNDFNVLAAPDGRGGQRITGILDVGDALVTVRVAELAIAAAYAMLRKDDPLTAAADVVAGFHEVVPLTSPEIAAIFPLAAARLCVNATTWTRRVREEETAYGRQRMLHTWPTLEQLVTISPQLAEARLRLACGLDAASSSGALRAWLVTGEAVGLQAVVPGVPSVVEIDTSAGSDLFDAADWSDPAAVGRAVDHRLGARDTTMGVTRHLRPSLLWARQRGSGVAEPATVQLGVGLLPVVETQVRVPLAGTVVRTGGDGPVVVRHEPDGAPFWTCWWGLASAVPVGAMLQAGEPLGVAAAQAAERGLSPHVQVQVVESADLAAEPPPRRVRPSEAAIWSVLCPDPAALLGLSCPAQDTASLDVHGVVSLRDQRLGRSQRAYYRRPMNLVRGRGAWLFDENGMGYLDAINNVSHVGHADPRVASAAARQMHKLNTNSRFVYEGIASYADRLAATLPAPLDVVFLVCTGSEANDLALRIARQVTARQDMIVIDGAYHGNTTAVTGISPNRYKGPGGAGAPRTTHEAMQPDRYRGPYGYDEQDVGGRYAADVAAVADRLVREGRPPAGFIAESLMGTAGNIMLPDGYLRAAFHAVRAVGGLCISDEVQVGLGRLGDAFWGFELQGVVPDIVTMGKPLGNGHPIAAVVTSREIADAFDNGMKYFNTFGGNPVSCAVGHSVLDIVQGDGLQASAKDVGTYFLGALHTLSDRHPVIGEVRGQGLYIGIELVHDRVTKEPAAAAALQIAERMKDNGVIVYPTGVRDNVLKIKPPMVFDRGHVDLFVETLDRVLPVLSAKF